MRLAWKRLIEGGYPQAPGPSRACLSADPGGAPPSPRLTSACRSAKIDASPRLGPKDNQTKQPKEMFQHMIKLKLLVGLAALMTTLVVFAAPASAEFSSRDGKTTGRIKSFPATSTFSVVPTSSRIECKNESGEAAGEWEIQAKATNAEGFQGGQLKGPHEQLKISKWGKCKVPTGGFPVTVKCSLQVEQVTSSLFTGSTYPPGCVVVTGTEPNLCTITVAAEKANTGLTEVKVVNKGVAEVEIGSNVSNITSKAVQTGKGCEAILVPLGTKNEGTFKTGTESIVTEGQTTTTT
jgi:hypothetical protein